ncbi:MAG: CRTAC1 family protein [Alphaproteobacteria bacterium]|nr:CRTAC1 family protein [Alphaproteobacteria bacterium]
MTLFALLLGCPSEPSTPDVPTPPHETMLVEVAAPTCAEPSLRTTGTPFAAFTLPDATPASELYVWGGGIVAEDFDGDGQHELITIRDGLAEYLDWTGSTWVERDGLPALDLEHGFGGAVADLDADGDADLVITRWGQPNYALENDGTGAFTDATARFGLAGPPGHHSGAPSFADIDGDGDLDLLVAGHGFVDEANPDPTQFAPADDSLLYLRLADGSYLAQRDRIPDDAHARYTFLGGFTDFDRDGAPDLLMVNDFGRRYRSGQLLWNDGTGHFTPDGNRVGLDLAVAGMGLGVAELNGDGVPDVLVPYWAGYALMVSSGPIWADFSVVSGLQPGLAANQTVGWGAMFGDLDNDGADDAIVMHGYIETAISDNDPVQPDALFHREGSGWVNATAEWDQLDVGDSRGLVVADLDGDGWLDYARPDLSGPTKVYMGRCGEASWVSVALEQAGPNPRAVGAVIEVLGEPRQWRQVTAGGVGYGSSVPSEVHFGLGSTEIVDLQITWPDGEITTFEAVDARRRWKVVR